MDVFNQYAALPYVIVDGALLILLVTSRESRRWVLPKGWHKDGLTPSELAALETYEEAGLKGNVAPEAMGWYTYTKRLHFFSRVTCRVDIFPMQVDHHLLDWPERDQRTFGWFSKEEASELVKEKGLSDFLSRLTLEDNELTLIKTEQLRA